MPHRVISSQQNANAKRLRRDMTDVERKLWYALRNSRFAAVKFRRQVLIGPYIVDFVSPSARLVIELDGSQHVEMETAARDLTRDLFIRHQGYRILRFWNFQINSEFDAVLDQIYSALAENVTPHPDPSFTLHPSSGLRPPSPTRGRVLNRLPSPN